MKEQNFKYVSIKDVAPYERNPRRNDQAVDAVAESIKQFGFLQPIVLDKNGTIVAGHTRYKAAKKLKLISIPVVYASDLTPEQVRKYRILDNKLNELACWDFELLSQEVDDLEFEGFEDYDFGFDDFGCEEPEVEGSENLPEELKGTELKPDELVKFKGDDKTKLDRIIIVYPTDRKGVLVDILGLSVINKVVYSLDDIEKERAERNAGN
jgi:ParB family transcriptional regulator, chromosome partitioning protein